MLVSSARYSLRLGTVAVLVVAVFGLGSTQALAASPSPSPTVSPEASASAETTEKLKARIEKIVEEKKSQIMGAINTLQQERRGFIGEVQRVSAETITLKTSKGTQILVINKDVGVTKAGKAITVDAIAVGDWAMVIGHTEDDMFLPDLIDISSESLRPKTHLIAIGTLTDVARNTVTFKAKNQETEQKLNIVRTSQYQTREGDDLTFADVDEGSEVLLIGQQNGNNWEVELIRVLTPAQ